MPTLAIELAAVFLLLLANGAFAMSELAVVMAKRLRLRRWALGGDRRAQKVLAIMDAPERFLSTVQIGITLVGILSGAVGGATLASHIESFLLRSMLDSVPAAKFISVAFVVALLTFFSILIGELVPKRIALRDPEKIALRIVVPMEFLSRLAFPVVSMLSNSTRLIFRILGLGRAQDSSKVTGEDVSMLVAQGTLEGTFGAAEQAMFERVLSFGGKRLFAIMTPRRDIVWLNASDTLEQHRERIRNSAHSHFPVAAGTLDRLVGVINIKDLFCLEVSSPAALAALTYQPLFVPETSTTLNALDLFKQSGIHMAFVIDEYGSLQGMITLNDVFEAIVGDFPLRASPAAEPIIAREDGASIVDGLLGIDTFKTSFKLGALPEEGTAGFQTVGGFVVRMMGHIPLEAEVFHWNGLRFEVLNMDCNRVDKVLVSRA